MAIKNFSFTANSQNSAELKAKDGNLVALSLDFTTGSGTGTIAVERKIGSGAWLTMDSYTADTEKIIEAVNRQCIFRCTTTAHSGGTIVMNMATPG